jgi:hypothetical protein
MGNYHRGDYHRGDYHRGNYHRGNFNAFWSITTPCNDNDNDIRGAGFTRQPESTI